MVIRGPDPHNLRAAAEKQPAPIIETDRECVGCGYNLRGLRVGITCPECGMPTTAIPGADDPLSTMPTRVIVAFVRGCWVASICIVLTIGVVIAARFPAVNPSFSRMALIGVSILWFGAVLWLTPAFSIPQAVARGFSQRSRLRRATRWLQLGWIIASVASFQAGTTGTSWSALLNSAQWLGFISGIAGIVMLSILLERLSDWTRDTDAARMFNWAMWGLPIATFLIVADYQSPILQILTLAIWLAVTCTFPYGLISLTGSVTLSILHSIEYRDRMERREQRDQQYHAHVGQAVAKMDSARTKK